ncbi:MAG TPA: hypothetical protein VL588_11255, partial [Bdellovibrionota bacterium]|nr:hypothetical protein [Bdellovibrionota bacterium]
MTDSIAEDPFKAIVWDNLEAGVLAWIFAEAPYLAWGPLRWIVTEVVTLVMDKAYELGKKAWNWEKVEFLVDLHRSQYEKAALHLKVV